jgi:hypothetical protein
MDLLHELRQSLRSLARVRGYTMLSVLTLALGFGASTAIYSLLERVVLDPLPFPESDRLVRLKNLVPAVSDHNKCPVAPQ